LGGMTKRTPAATDPKIAVAYVRVSTEDQNLGPEAQRASIEAWAGRHGVTVAAWFTDKGVSGGKAVEDRPALLEAFGSAQDSQRWLARRRQAGPNRSGRLGRRHC
jgi:Resolvase, N terminal domain